MAKRKLALDIYNGDAEKDCLYYFRYCGASRCLEVWCMNHRLHVIPLNETPKGILHGDCFPLP